LHDAIFTNLLGHIISATINDHHRLWGSIEKSVNFIKTVERTLMAFGGWLTQLNVTTTAAEN